MKYVKIIVAFLCLQLTFPVHLKAATDDNYSLKVKENALGLTNYDNAYDVNSDGTTNVFDVIRIKQEILSHANDAVVLSSELPQYDISELSDAVIKGTENNENFLIDDVYDFGLGLFLTSERDFSKNSNYAYCVKIKNAHRKFRIRFDKKCNVIIRDNISKPEFKLNINSIESSSFNDYDDTIFLEIYKSGDKWGTKYTSEWLDEARSFIHIENGCIDNAFVPLTKPYVVQSDGTEITSYLGHWANYMIDMKKDETIKIVVPKSASDYPVLYEKTPDGISIIDNSSYTNETLYYTAPKDMQLWVQINVKTSSETYDPPEFYRENRSSSSLDGLHLCCIGDSYIANNGEPIKYTWCSKLAAKHNMRYTMLGMNGSGVCATRKGVTPIKDRYTNIPADSDIIILEGGENDYNVSYDIDTFKTEYEELVSNILSKYTNSKLIIMCPWGAGADFREPIKPYADAEREIANKYGVPFFDSWKVYIPSYNKEMRSLYYQASNDSSHLNNTGHNLIMPLIESFIESII